MAMASYYYYYYYHDDDDEQPKHLAWSKCNKMG